jgi:ankyrin repeat protein
VDETTKSSYSNTDLAARHESPECLRVLLDFGVDKPERRFGYTPLMESSIVGRVECVRLLLENNADVQLHVEHGETGLILAAWKGQLDCLQLMIDAKADVNQQTTRGCRRCTQCCCASTTHGLSLCAA